MSNSHQLTKYPIGSIREIWALAWPLMFGLMSGSLMIFVDRLLLSLYSTNALTACANAGMAYYVFLVIPLSICAISEVLVGRLQGEGNLRRAGNAVWQMFWFSIILSPIFLLISLIGPYFLFSHSINHALETDYFQILIWFAPFMCSSVALSGFFIGTGRVKIVTCSTILGNLINVGLGYILIFGLGPIPSLGIAGAALGTGISELLQTCFLIFFLLRKENREAYGTENLKLNKQFFWEGLKIGSPAGFGHAIEVFAHFLFFQIVMMVGSEHLTIVVLIQTFYWLICFIIEAQSKAVSAIVSNLIGAKKYDLIGGVFKSSLKLQSSFFLLILGLVTLFPNHLLNLFAYAESASFLKTPHFEAMFFNAAFFMSIFFLFDGISWILIGHLTASGDTKYIFQVSSLVNGLAYVFPTFFIIGVGQNGADAAWMILAGVSIINFAIYYHRYRSGKWLQKEEKDEAEEEPDEAPELQLA